MHTSTSSLGFRALEVRVEGFSVLGFSGLGFFGFRV